MTQASTTPSGVQTAKKAAPHARDRPFASPLDADRRTWYPPVCRMAPLPCDVINQNSPSADIQACHRQSAP